MYEKTRSAYDMLEHMPSVPSVHDLSHVLHPNSFSAMLLKVV